MSQSNLRTLLADDLRAFHRTSLGMPARYRIAVEYGKARLYSIYSFFLLSRLMRHSTRLTISTNLTSKTRRAGPSGMTYGDRTGNKPQNTSPQLNADNINHTDTTQHIIIHNSSYMMAPPYGSDPTTCQRQAASIQYMRWSGEPPQRTNALGVPHRLVGR